MVTNEELKRLMEDKISDREIKLEISNIYLKMEEFYKETYEICKKNFQN